MTTIVLTKEQMDSIRMDMDQKCEMLTDAEVLALAQKVNEAINLPFLGEEAELKVFVKIVRFVDKELYKLLPNEYYELVHNATDGITKEEADEIINRLTPLINSVVNIPVIPEVLEGKLIELILRLIINCLIKGSKLDETTPA
jgi:hypothetical protein